MKEFIKKWRLLAFLSMAILTLSLVFGCGDDDDKGNEEVQLPPAAVLPEVSGGGELTAGNNIVPTAIPANATVETPEVQEFLELYRLAITSVGNVKAQQARSADGESAGAQPRNAISTVISGSANGGVRVVQEKGGNIDTDRYVFESLTNEFFDFSNSGELFLGGGVGYLNTQVKNQNDGVNVVEQSDGTILFAGRFRGKIVYNNVVRTATKNASGQITSDTKVGEFYLESHNGTKVNLPNNMLADFVYRPSEESVIVDETEFVAVTSVRLADIADLGDDIAYSVNVGAQISTLASVVPFQATNRTIVWSVTGATLSADNRTITFGTRGTATITATIANGATATTPFVQTWTVTVVGADEFVPVARIGVAFEIPEEVLAGTSIGLDVLNPTVLPANATNKTIVWSAQNATLQMSTAAAGTTSSTVTGILFDKAGDATITATIANGATATTAFVQTWTLTVLPPKAPDPTPNPGTLAARLINADGEAWTDRHRSPQGERDGLVFRQNASFASIYDDENGNWFFNEEDAGRWYLKGDSLFITLHGFTEDVAHIRISANNDTLVISGYICYSDSDDGGGGIQEPTVRGSRGARISSGIRGSRSVRSDGEAQYCEIVMVKTVVGNINSGTNPEPNPTPNFVPVTGVSVDPEGNGGLEAPLGYSITVKQIMEIAQVTPANATNRTITSVSVVSGATLIGGNAPAGVTSAEPTIVFDKVGTAVIRVEIKDGLAPGQNFVQDISIKVVDSGWTEPNDPAPQPFVPVTDISFPSGHQFASTSNDVIVQVETLIALNLASVLPQNATNKKIVWSVENATLQGNEHLLGNATIVIFDKVGKATITATIANGAEQRNDFVRIWTVTVVQK